MNENENTARCWEDYGSWENRAALCGDSICKRLEAIRLAVLERCKLCGEPVQTLEKPFGNLYSLAGAVRIISDKLKRILPYFVAVEEGKIRKLTLRTPDGFYKTWQQVPMEDFTDEFEAGKLSFKAGCLNLQMNREGDLTGPEDVRIILYAECYTAGELIPSFPVFLPDAANLTLLGDWMFGIQQLLKKLTIPLQEIDVSFQLVEYTGAERNFLLRSCPSRKEWNLNGVSGSGTLSEEAAWNRTEESTTGNNYAEVRRLRTEYTGDTDGNFFGDGVSYSELEVCSSSWSRTIRNVSRRIIARSDEPLPIHIQYGCRFDAVENLPFLLGSYAEGDWQMLIDQTVEANEIRSFASAPISRPASGYGARTDRYRRCSLSLQCPFDHCGLQFL